MAGKSISRLSSSRATVNTVRPPMRNVTITKSRIMRKVMFSAKLGAVVVAAMSLSSLAQNTATVSTNLSFLTSNPASGNVKMVMALVNCGQNNPRVIGGG